MFNNDPDAGSYGAVHDDKQNPHIIALLFTSRQIHAETHLLPFTLNFLRWCSPDAFNHSITRFLPNQREALLSIEIPTKNADYFVRQMTWSTTCSELRKILPNVESVKLYTSERVRKGGPKVV